MLKSKLIEMLAEGFSSGKISAEPGRTAYYSRLTPKSLAGENVPTREWVMQIVTSGEARHDFGPVRRISRPGDFLLIAPGTPQSYSHRPGTVLCVLTFNLHPKKNSFKPGHVFLPKARALFPHLKALILESHRPKNRWSAARRRSTFTLLFTEMAERVHNIAAKGRGLSRAQQEIFRTHLSKSAGEIPNPETFAKRLHLSPEYFSRLFRETYGETPRGYLARERLVRAAELLCQPKSSIENVAAQSGFESLPTFSRRFKKVFGESPKDYRSRILAAQ
ncbi:MAG: AraC family transcriptional regulator [Spirochaetia bacterium]|nr:AraC family transcriptional regulator [Spirochaetia bacterium]